MFHSNSSVFRVFKKPLNTDCQIGFASRNDLASHTRDTHGQEKFACDTCTKMFANRKLYLQHTKSKGHQERVERGYCPIDSTVIAQSSLPGQQQLQGSIVSNPNQQFTAVALAITPNWTNWNIWKPALNCSFCKKWVLFHFYHLLNWLIHLFYFIEHVGTGSGAANGKSTGWYVARDPWKVLSSYVRLHARGLRSVAKSK